MTRSSRAIVHNTHVIHAAPCRNSPLAAVAAQRQALLKSYEQYGDYAWAAEAVGAATGWNFKVHPGPPSLLASRG
jgi:hypothetical protein